ncbi:unnamed protein product [Caenorhabditis angaria]|uniref:Uncharacterized protein n=1 Tax=Caenorhabditis angaria TaxID=860376 RepID=A0A9P1N9H5_9PELO|nr:unnamed protein product [Caenorhabditis angaria]
MEFEDVKSDQKNGYIFEPSWSSSNLSVTKVKPGIVGKSIFICESSRFPPQFLPYLMLNNFNYDNVCYSPRSVFFQF